MERDGRVGPHHALAFCGTRDLRLLAQSARAPSRARADQFSDVLLRDDARRTMAHSIIKSVALLALLSAAPVGAQEAAPPPGQKIDIITPHITDSHEIDYPCLKAGLVCRQELPHWAPVHVGPVTLDLSPTKHVVMLWIAAILCSI